MTYLVCNEIYRFLVYHQTASDDDPVEGERVQRWICGWPSLALTCLGIPTRSEHRAEPCPIASQPQWYWYAWPRNFRTILEIHEIPRNESHCLWADWSCEVFFFWLAPTTALSHRSPPRVACRQHARQCQKSLLRASPFEDSSAWTGAPWYIKCCKFNGPHIESFIHVKAVPLVNMANHHIISYPSI